MQFLCFCFNPHPREGGDFRAVLKKAVIGVSIRTPVKGVIYFYLPSTDISVVSIRTPVKGVILTGDKLYASTEFQSAPP